MKISDLLKKEKEIIDKIVSKENEFEELKNELEVYEELTECIIKYRESQIGPINPATEELLEVKLDTYIRSAKGIIEVIENNYRNEDISRYKTKIEELEKKGQILRKKNWKKGLQVQTKPINIDLNAIQDEDYERKI